uniref:Carbonic anhydrase n=1 Tax=Mola mola TaxID=94237 RepID=A0A3Q4AD87_MOLML
INSIIAQVTKYTFPPSEWCYHDGNCSYEKWPELFPKYCNGTRQSPININSSKAQSSSELTAFTFTNFNSTTALKKIENTGKTVKVTFNSGVQVSGGNLPETYDALQFHLHWGNGSTTRGSEHTVDGTFYPMELHIVTLKSSFNGNTTQGVADSQGLAALGFFIDIMDGDATDSPDSWRTLTSYLTNITNTSDYANITSALSLDDLLSGPNREKYFRYLGSLTTPACNEAVIWTVFKEPIKVSKNLIDLFSTTVRIGNTSSSFITNAFRGIQSNDLEVTTQADRSSCSTMCSTKG